MFVVTVLTSPTTPFANSDMVQSLAARWGGDTVQWLAPLEAARFTVATLPDDIDATWTTLQAQKADLVVMPHAQAKPKRMLLADMDSTMIQQECIDELAAEAGIGDKVAGITARAMNGEIAFEEALIERVGLLRGLPVSVIDKVLTERIDFMTGGATLLATMKARGAYAALVSGGFTAFTAKVAAHLGFDENRANTLLEDGGKLSGAVGMPILGADAKVEALQQITARLDIPVSEVLAVGDGANDLPMLTRAGLGVALHAKPSVQAQAKVRINHGDLTALLYLQGIAKADFVTPALRA